MTIKEIISNINFGQDAFILILVMGSAYIQMSRVESYQHALEQDFARYIDNTKQIQSIADQIVRYQEDLKYQEFEYRTLYDQYTNQKNFSFQLQKQLNELKKENEQLKAKIKAQ